MKKKTNNYRLWMKKLCCFLLAFAMIFSNVSIVKAEAATATTEAELITKVNPYLKSYDVSDAGKLWTITSATRFVVDATDANIANERLAEVVKLINAELVEKEISQATLRKDLNIATGTMTKLRKNEEVALSILLRICEYLNCNIGDICDAVVDESEVGDEE